MTKIYHVFVSSTYADLIDERKKVSEAIAKAGYVAEGMEIFPASSQKQFDFIKRIIDRCDYYILIISGRYGSIYEEDKSYTWAEFEYALSTGTPVLALLRSNLDGLPEEELEQESGLRDKLKDFRSFAEDNSLVDYWSTADEAGMKAIAALSQEVSTNPGIGWIRGDKAAGVELLSELNDLRKHNTELKKQVAANEGLQLNLDDSAEIAGLEDEYSEQFNLTHARFRDKEVEFGKSWGEMLAIIGLGYRTRSNAVAAKSSLSRFYGRKYEGYSLKADYDQLERILVQFQVLGLMTGKVLSLKNGGSAVFYKLTDRGLVETQKRLITLKKPEEPDTD